MLRRLFSPKAEVFELDPKYFPESTQNVFPLEMVLRHGVLPLGYKGKKLNVGFLDPESKSDLEAVKKHLSDASFQRYEIRVDEMLKLLEARFQVLGSELQQHSLHPIIQKHLS